MGGTDHIEPLEVAVDVSDGVATLVVAGEVDIFSLPRLRQAISETEGPGPARIVIDLREVTFIDARGANTLVDAAVHCRARGVEFVLQHPSTAVSRMLHLLSLDETELLDPPL